MALELLSGPNPLIDVATGLPVAAIESPRPVWVDPVGLLFVVSAGGFALAQMDGTVAQHGMSFNNYGFGLSLIGGAATVPDSGRKWYSLMQKTSSAPALEYKLDEVHRSFGTQLRSDAPPSANLSNNPVTLADRTLRLLGSIVQYYDGANWITERTIAGFANGSYGSWAREGSSIWIGGTTGLLVRYDCAQKLETSRVFSIGMSCKGLWYSKKHDVFVSLHNDAGAWSTRVWARTVKPASISAPQAESAVNAGRVVTLKCRVLGDASEPCEGEVVSWSMTGEGSLSPLTSETDAEGWARTTWTIPLTAVGPSADINVQVSC